MDADLSTIVLLVGNIRGADGIAQLSENNKYEVRPDPTWDLGWKGGQTELEAPFFCLFFGKDMYSPEGWTFGSSDDTDLCDIQLAKDNTSGVSRRHFRIDLSPLSHKPRFTSLSRNPVQLRINENDRLYFVTFNSLGHIDITSSVEVDLGEIQLRLWRPTLTAPATRKYRRNVEKFSQEFMDALPRPSGRLDTHTGTSTFDMRFGKNNAVYKRVSAIATSGSFASVMQVQELRSQKIFAAKIPHFKMADGAGTSRDRLEKLTDEFQKLTTLQHVNVLDQETNAFPLTTL